MRISHPRRATELLCIVLFSLTLLGQTSLRVQAQELRERSEIADKYKWDLTTLYKTDQDWEADMATLETMIPNLKSYEGKISQSPDDLLAFFQASEEIGKKFGNAAVYASLAYDQDTRVQEYTGFKDRISTLGSKFGEATSWSTPELISIPDATFEQWYKDKPALALYRHSIDDALRTRAHTLSHGAIRRNGRRILQSQHRAARNRH
jgi:oligoendopeptidase F